jgi:hypothetical protein
MSGNGDLNELSANISLKPSEKTTTMLDTEDKATRWRESCGIESTRDLLIALIAAMIILDIMGLWHQ